MLLHLIMILSLSVLTIGEEFETTTMESSIVEPESYVNCGHAERLLQVDSTQYGVGAILDACWRRGVTADELAYGISSLSDLREDMENYGFEELLVPCEDVFSANLTRLTSSLLEDYVGCVARDAVNDLVKAEIDDRFAEILQVYKDGNSSVTVNERTLFPCANASPRLTLLCREYGLTGDQWSRGFLRYHHADKWAVEEQVADLSLGCDRIFNAKLHEEAYENDFLEVFLGCEASLGVDSEIRDDIEKKYAEELMLLRGGSSIDLRGYVSCRHLIPVSLKNGAFSASWYAYDQCRAEGLTYEQLCNGTIVQDDFDILPRLHEDVRDMYVECESVFNEELWSFTTGLIKDYHYCKQLDKVDQDSAMMLQKKFARLFELLATKRLKKTPKTIIENLIPCSGLKGALADECRRHGSTLAQELRGIGSLGLILDDKWLNTEPLDKLYIRCDDVFDKYIAYLDDVPLDKFVQCRWNEAMSEDGVAYVDIRVAEEYRNDWKNNDTRFIGDSDVQISSTILFDDDEQLPVEQVE